MRFLAPRRSCSRPGSFRLAAPAFAGDNGEGLVGETDDKIVTFFSLGLVIFFTVFVIVATSIQGALEQPQGGAQGRRAPQARRLVKRQAPKTRNPGGSRGHVCEEGSASSDARAARGHSV